MRGDGASRCEMRDERKEAQIHVAAKVRHALLMMLSVEYRVSSV